MIKFGKYEFNHWEDFEYGSRRKPIDGSFAFITIYKIFVKSDNTYKYSFSFEGELGYLTNEYRKELKHLENDDMYKLQELVDDWITKMDNLRAFW